MLMSPPPGYGAPQTVNRQSPQGMGGPSVLRPQSLALMHSLHAPGGFSQPGSMPPMGMQPQQQSNPMISALLGNRPF